MHIHGAPVYGPAEREPEGSGQDSGGNRQRDDFSQLFLTAAPLPSHLPATFSRKRTVPAMRLALLSKLAENKRKEVDTDRVNDDENKGVELQDAEELIASVNGHDAEELDFDHFAKMFKSLV